MIRKRLLRQNIRLSLAFGFIVCIAITASFLNWSVWKRYDDSINTRRNLVTDIFRYAGYAGGIHAFKNMILRRDLSYYRPAKDSFEQSLKLIDEYQTLPGVTATELTAIRTMRDVFEHYLNNLDIASTLIPQNLSIQEIDRIVKIDDTPTAQQLKILSTELDRLDTEAENRVKRNFTYTAAAFLLACLLSFALTLRSSIKLAADVKRFLDRLEKHSREISEGNYENPIAINESKDFGSLAKTMDSMREKLGIATHALRVTISDLERFSFAASHDLQEPLRKINLLSDFLQEDLGASASAETKANLEGMKRSISRMSALVSGLLDYSRFGNEARFTIELNHLVSAIWEDLAPPTAQTQLEVTDLPSVFAGPTEMRQLFQNILSNAIKFRRREEYTNHIKIVSKQMPNSRFLVSISDEGIGIDEVNLNRIFVPFERLNLLSDYPGSGLGLSLCKKIVEHHGGNLVVHSQYGMGTTFEFDLPAGQDSELQTPMQYRPGNVISNSKGA